MPAEPNEDPFATPDSTPESQHHPTFASSDSPKSSSSDSRKPSSSDSRKPSSSDSPNVSSNSPPAPTSPSSDSGLSNEGLADDAHEIEAMARRLEATKIAHEKEERKQAAELERARSKYAARQRKQRVKLGVDSFLQIPCSDNTPQRDLILRHLLRIRTQHQHQHQHLMSDAQLKAKVSGWTDEYSRDASGEWGLLEVLEAEEKGLLGILTTGPLMKMI